MAIKMRYIQMNPPDKTAFLIYDVDRTGAAFAAEEADLPPATFTVVNRENKHAHLIYALNAPVCVSSKGLPGPRGFLEAIRRSYSRCLGADRLYTGLICNNPFSQHWDTMQRNAVYDLSELADYVDLTRREAEAVPEIDAPGRNCAIFDNLRKWAYQAVRDYWDAGFDTWAREVFIKAAQCNSQMTRPLCQKELIHIVRSVSRWTWREHTPESLDELIARTHTPELQRARRAKRTEKESKKGQGLALLGQGFSLSKAAKALGVNQSTVARWEKCANSK
jgi:hypothetical protein